MAMDAGSPSGIARRVGSKQPDTRIVRPSQSLSSSSENHLLLPVPEESQYKHKNPEMYEAYRALARCSYRAIERITQLTKDG